jgi:hypothetical protein
MTREQRSVLAEGVMAGLIGATAVAVWFMLFDIARGRPLLTPALLGAAVFRGVTDPAGVEVAALPILGYTLLHGLAFVGFGVIAASLVALSEKEPPLFVGFVILFASFEAFFLGVISAFGESLLGALVWWAILIGNLLAAAAMLWYLFRGHPALPRLLIGPWGPVLSEGMVAGLIGAVVVAVWFLAIDTIRGTPLRTPLLLGSALLDQPQPLPAILLYTVLHGMAFVVFGVLASFLVAGAEREPMFVFALVILFAAFEVFFFAALVVGASWLVEELAAWTIFAANVFAATGMLGYFFRRHRTLATRLAHAWTDGE